MLYKVTVEGGSREPLWNGGNPVEAPGRNTLLYTKIARPGIYERSLSGEPRRNRETMLVPDLVPLQSLCVTSDGIFYTGLSRPGLTGVLRFYSFATRKSSDIASAEAGSTVSLKPDRSSLAYDGNAAPDSQLVEIKLN